MKIRALGWSKKEQSERSVKGAKVVQMLFRALGQIQASARMDSSLEFNCVQMVFRALGMYKASARMALGWAELGFCFRKPSEFLD